jgi:2-dehydropantoate 2-reductase
LGGIVVKNIRVAIYGAGAMGTILGAFLTECNPDTEIDLISKNKPHIEAMKQNGAQILCSANDRTMNIKVRALLPEEMSGKYDILFLMTKQRENEKILQFLKGYLHAESAVCTTQNGLPEGSVAKVVGAENTYGAACAWGATFIGNGKVELTSSLDSMSLQIGAYDGKGEKLSALKELLKGVGEVCGNPDFLQTTDNLVGARWSKLSINAAFSGLSVVTGLTFGEIAKRRKTKPIALGILRECFAVTSAAGIRLEKMQGYDMKKLLGGESFFGKCKALFVLPIAMKKHKRLLSGMLKDVQNGKKCEIDYVDGMVCRYGDAYGVDTPLCDKVVELVHGIETGLYEISPENIDFFA